jgi:hypothetical protein
VGSVLAFHGETAADEEEGTASEGDDADEGRNEVLLFGSDLEGAEIDGFFRRGEADALTDEDEKADDDEKETDDEFRIHRKSGSRSRGW